MKHNEFQFVFHSFRSLSTSQRCTWMSHLNGINSIRWRQYIILAMNIFARFYASQDSTKVQKSVWHIVWPVLKLHGMNKFYPRQKTVSFSWTRICSISRSVCRWRGNGVATVAAVSKQKRISVATCHRIQLTLLEMATCECNNCVLCNLKYTQIQQFEVKTVQNYLNQLAAHVQWHRLLWHRHMRTFGNSTVIYACSFSKIW